MPFFNDLQRDFMREQESRIAKAYLHCDESELNKHFLGRGRIGVVYELKMFGRKAAVKIVSVSMQDLNPGVKLDDLLDSAENEKSIITKLHKRSKYLVAYDNTETYKFLDQSGKCIGIDYVTYMELLRPITTLKLDENDIRQLAENICNAVIAIHDKHVIHRDIGPKNVFYDDQSRIYKLGDYDLAKFKKSMVASSYGVGDPLTMAPELWPSNELAGLNYDGKRIDIYSLGKTLELLYMKTDVYSKIASGGRRNTTPIQIISKIDSGLASVIEIATKTNPNDRFATATDMLKAIVK